MFYRIGSKIAKKYFDYSVRKILNTAEARCNKDASFTVLTQLHPPDVIMYLLAVKSFSRFLQPKRYLIVDDHLTESNRKLIEDHLECVDFIEAQSQRLDRCPSGGCWERLLSIANLNESQYVIQLDADTLTIREPTEVIQSVADGRSFTLGTYRGREVTSLQAASDYAKAHRGDHVQVVGEIALDDFPGSDQLRYVRGCAGFAGFAKHTIQSEEVQRFSNTMAGLISEAKWGEWGSEQLTSNFFIANSENPFVLPVETYPFMSTSIDLARCKLIHFYGSNRFLNGTYAELSRGVIAELTAH